MGIQEGHIVGIDTDAKGVKQYNVLLNSYDSSNGKWAFSKETVSELALMKAIINKKVHICNAEVKNEKLHGTTGSLTRFTPSKNIGIKPMVILSELRTDDGAERLLGYKVSTHDGAVKNIKLRELLSYCSRITNKAKEVKSDTVPIQNAQYVEGATDKDVPFIRSYIDNQFLVENIKVGKPDNVVTAKVDTEENKKQLSKLEELFTKEQIRELKLGKDKGINYRLYGNNKLSAQQMAEIRKALEVGLDPRPYADPAFKADTMKAYRIQSKYGIDISHFINPEYSPEQIMELSTAWISGVDISSMNDTNMSVNDMSKLRIELESKIWKEMDVSVLDIINSYIA